jgi:hypothetical protein
MKKLVLTLGIFFAGLFAVQAQDANADKQTEKLMNDYTTVCSLTPDQAAKVKPMIQTFVQTRMDNRQKYQGDKDGMKAANKQNRENLDNQLKTVLSADQIQKMKDYMAQKKQERMNKQGAGGDGGASQE